VYHELAVYDCRTFVRYTSRVNKDVMQCDVYKFKQTAEQIIDFGKLKYMAEKKKKDSKKNAKQTGMCISILHYTIHPNTGIL
jgi:translation initiation factor IF-3